MDTPAPLLDLTTLQRALHRLRRECPWHKEQNFSTIAPYTLEEAYEVLDAIERNNKQHLCEELGDLLYQVLYHAQLAQEEGSFTIADVVSTLEEKIKRRHPHVFSDTEVRSLVQVREQWLALKQKEKEDKSLAQHKVDQSSYLDSVKRVGSPYAEAIELQAKAAEVGFCYENTDQVLDKIIEETEELRSAVKEKREPAIGEELGDLLFTVLNLARRLNMAPHFCLKKASSKFRRRFLQMEINAKKLGYNFFSLNRMTLNKLWMQSKKHEQQKEL